MDSDIEELIHQMEKKANEEQLFPLSTIVFRWPGDDVKPCSDVALYEEIYPLHQDFADRLFKPKIRTDESEAPAFSIQGVQVYGMLKADDIQPVGTNWRGLLDASILANVDKRGEVKVLRPLQGWIFTMITYDYPGIVCANRGFRKTLGFVLPLVQKIRTNIIGSPSSKRSFPLALVITASDAKAEHVGKQLKWAASGSKVYARLIKHDTFNGEAGRVDIIVGKATRVTDFITHHNLSLKKVDSVLFVECENVRANNALGEGLEKAAGDLMALLKKQRKEIPCTLLLYNEHTKESSEVLRQYLPDFSKCSKVEQTCVTYQNPPQFKIIQCNMETSQIMQFKMVYLRSIVDKVKLENADETRKTCRKCVIVVSSVMVANYLAGYLSTLYDECFPLVTRESDAVSVESARLHVRTGDSNFTICDYKALTYLEPGFIDYVVMFELPPADIFEKKIFGVLHLSSQISFKVVYAFFDPIRDEPVTLNLVRVLMVLHQKIPRSLFDQASEMIQVLKATEASLPSPNDNSDYTTTTAYSTANEGSSSREFI